MTTRFGIDEAWQRLTPAQLAAAGKTFVVGYVSEDASGKNLTAAEVAAYHAAGIAVLLVYEYSTTAIEGGATKGHHDAAIAIAHARQLGYPTGCAIGWAVDENTTGRASVIDAYARAMTGDLHAAGYRSLDYGGLATVQRCADLGLADLHWQTYAWSGSPTVWDPRAAIRQVQNGVVLDGKDIDLDVAVVDDFGAWLPNGGTSMALLNDAQRDDLLQQCTSVLGAAYAHSRASGDNPVLGIGDQVAALYDALVRHPAGPGTLTDAQVTALGTQIGAVVAQPIADLTVAVQALTARLAAAGHALQG